PAWQARGATDRRPSAAGGVMNAGGLDGRELDLFGQRHGARGGAAGGFLVVGRGGESEEQGAAEQVMEMLVRLDDIAIERGRDLVPRPVAELDELPILHDGDRLAGELPRGHELLGRHAGTPVLRSSGSSRVSVSLVTTLVQRPWRGCVSRARAWVVKPSTGGRGVTPSSA